MAIIIRDAEVRRDRKRLMDCLLRNRSRYQDDAKLQRRFEWAYDDNPHGEGRAWLAIDQASDKVVGYTSAYPRHVTVNGDTVIGWNCSDFSIDQKYRTLGVAIKLRRAAKECVDRGEFPFIFAHPNDRMRVVHDKVGHHDIGSMVRYALLLRLDKMLAAVAGDNLLSRGLATLANPVVKFVHLSKNGKKTRYKFRAPVENCFGEEYDKLFARVKNRYPVIGNRDAAYLTWRFLRNPLYTARSFRMEDGPDLKGFILFTVERNVAHVCDLLVEGGGEEMRLLTGAFIHYLHESGFCTISLRLHDHNPFLFCAQSLGFHYRDDATSAAIAYCSPGSMNASVLDGRNWFMTVGDRDI